MRQHGFSLIELIIAAAVTALGLSGLAALLLKSVTETTNAGYLTTAAAMAESLAARIRLVPDAAEDFLLQPPAATPGCGPAQACSPSDFAANSLFGWQNRVGKNLPTGSAIVCRDSTPDDGAPGSPACDATGALTIKVFWHDRSAPGSGFQRLSHSVAG